VRVPSHPLRGKQTNGDPAPRIPGGIRWWARQNPLPPNRHGGVTCSAPLRLDRSRALVPAATGSAVTLQTGSRWQAMRLGPTTRFIRSRLTRPGSAVEMSPRSTIWRTRSRNF
jgi:hypothetical protein